ncbi:MAG: type II toxin-antitoxin system PemK/MazF family toxin [Ilumatobacteraceae bacterium]|nr:type II toxin-antitoxin system PemK/MazF family toxin [Ilumatobacteraceae bacterium]
MVERRTVPHQGEVWWAEGLDKRRPVLVVTRSAIVPVLATIVVAPVSRTIREIPTELALGPEEGLPVECVATFDNLETIDWRGVLTTRIGAIAAARRPDLCRALRSMSAC